MALVEINSPAPSRAREFAKRFHLLAHPKYVARRSLYAASSAKQLSLIVPPQNPAIPIGNDLRVNRLGFGSCASRQRASGANPPIAARQFKFFRRAVISHQLIIPPIPTARTSAKEIMRGFVSLSCRSCYATKGGFDRSGPDHWTEKR